VTSVVVSSVIVEVTVDGVLVEMVADSEVVIVDCDDILVEIVVDSVVVAVVSDGVLVEIVVNSEVVVPSVLIVVDDDSVVDSIVVDVSSVVVGSVRIRVIMAVILMKLQKWRKTLQVRNGFMVDLTTWKMLLPSYEEVSLNPYVHSSESEPLSVSLKLQVVSLTGESPE
jgi:hypothetical protein